MTILDLVRIIRSNLKLLTVSLLLGMLATAGYTLTRPVLYTTASAAQIMAGSSADANSASINQQLAATRAPAYAQLAGGPGVAQNIIKLSNGALGGGDFAIAGIPAGGTTGTSITLMATSDSPAKAQLAANLAPKALAQEIKRVETLNGAKSTIFDAYQLSSAGRPAAPSSPKWTMNLIMGGALGLIAGLTVVVLRKQLDSRVRHTSEVERITGVGVLGVIPKASNLQTKARGGLGSLGTTSEAFRMLRTNLRYVSAEHPPRSLVVTSAVQGEGKSTVAANLARVLAAAGQKVVLVDTDLRRPVVHDTFDVDNTVGLTEVLTGQAALADVIQKGDHQNLRIITSGRIPPNPSELLGSRRMGAVIEALEEEYFVVLDAPPLLPVTDAGLLAVAASGAAVVYHQGKTHREQIALCTRVLEQVGAHNFGSVLNMTPRKEMGSTIYGYGAGNYGATGYGYGYGYGHSDDSSEAHALTPANELKDLTLKPEGTTAPTSVTPATTTPDTARPDTASAAAPEATPTMTRDAATTGGTSPGETGATAAAELPSRRVLRGRHHQN